MNCRDEDHITPIMLASSTSSNVKTIQILLQNSADVLCTDREDCTTLHVATKENNFGAVKVSVPKSLASLSMDERVDSIDIFF